MGLAILCFGAPPASAAEGAVGQASSQDKKAQADDLLRRARQAMAEGDLDGAGELISRAEALQVKYGPIPIGDTPQRVRRDLEGKRKSAAGSRSLPGRLLALPFQKKTQVTDPFAARNNAGASEPAASGFRSGSNGITPLPPVNQVSPVQPPSSLSRYGRSASAPPSSVGTGPARPAALGADRGTAQRVNSDELLKSARRALALRDVRRARGLVEQAQSLQVQYGVHDDSPARVETAIRKYEDFKAQPPERQNTEAYRRQYVKLLMEQAQSLLQWQEFAEAERLAREASRQRVSYSSFELRPESLLQQIDAARRQANPSAPASGLAGRFSAGGLAGRAAPSLAAKQKAVSLVRQAREAIGSGDLNRAESLARQAERMQVPQSQFRPGEDSPARVIAEIRSLRLRGGSNVIPAGGQLPVHRATGAYDPAGRAAHALYDPRHDPTRNVPAAGVEPYPGHASVAQNVPTPPRPVDAAAPGAIRAGMALFQKGEEAMRARDVPTAMRYFRQAADYRNDLDARTAQRLQEYLQMPGAPAGPGAPAPSMIDATVAKQQALLKQVHADVLHQKIAAERMRERDPKRALALLEETRAKVAAAGLEPAARDEVLRRIDRSLEQMRKYIEENRARIDLKEQNKQITDDIDRNRQLKLEIQEKLALMVDEFNRLMDEQRFAEAEVVAKRAAEMDPESPIVRQLLLQSKFVHRVYNNLSLREGREQSFWQTLDDVEQTTIVPVGDENPLVFPNARRWGEITRSRARLLAERRRGRSERELEIEQKLKTPVRLQFQDAPLSTVMDYLAKLADVNLHLDPQGLEEEAVSTDRPVTINLSQDISLKSALNLILQPLHLSYVIKDEVLKITSEQLRDGEVYTVTYSVADLVIPIPNFIPNQRMGLAGAYHDALGSIGFGGYNSFGAGAAPLAVVASRDGNQNSAMISSNLLAQMQAPGSPTAAASRGTPTGFGPGGLGGGAQADFDSLIDLITSTIRPDTWDEVGGPGSIAPFETNLSIVVSQTQDVHEEIVDLLEQLRRLQDLQVTIEVRFITLSDRFFERIGVDFDFDIDDKIDREYMIFGRPALDDDGNQIYTDDGNRNSLIARNTSDTDHQYDRSVAVGRSSPTTFSADLDIPFSQGSFDVAVPQFGGYDAASNTGAQIGFAILSDIEAFFFIEAAQGDQRTNVLQAPKVTLFNGQQAFVSDTSQSPFVISVVPVVGDFAAAQQPVIVVLNEGTFLTVQAVVSNDKRYVRLTVVPFFSRIDEVNTFQFTGTETTTEETSSEGDQEHPNQHTRNEQAATRTRSGTTVQLPTFSFVTVTTTVSVPDGGTVLLGGIKRLSEDRREYGVPMLNKIPYINRLFKNVGMGRDTSSMMMMVTPRIIIQEEEEERLGILPP